MKRLARALFLLPALFEVARFHLSRAIIGEDRALLGLSERLARRPGYLGIYLRAATYRFIVEQSSPDVHIGFGTLLSRREATLGDHVYIGRYCSLGWVNIDRGVRLADLVAVPSGAHTHLVSASAPDLTSQAEPRFRPVRIGEGTWVGTQAVLLADVGRFCVIGAGAVVTRPVPDHSIALGVPARVVGSTLAAGTDWPPRVTPGGDGAVTVS